MYEHAVLEKYKVDASGTSLQILIPGKNISEYITEKRCRSAEIRIDDGRTITSLQRRKAYATIRDISDWTGYFPEEQKEWLKYLHIERTGSDYFSLSDCSMDTAREFINTMLEYALEEGIPLSEPGVERTEDIGKYLYYCIKHKRCAVCGKDGEIHHVDTIGMGRDRRLVDDSNYRKICLCRAHHTAAHQRGMKAFEEMYHVYGIKV
ncbi:MAG TPA: hypothetical protein IAA00_02245 [Candidatus Blautia ornithocaccae]|nr:hypothetical protein [Candidatus Blautia ornithocaccae]